MLLFCFLLFFFCNRDRRDVQGTTTVGGGKCRISVNHDSGEETATHRRRRAELHGTGQQCIDSGVTHTIPSFLQPQTLPRVCMPCRSVSSLSTPQVPGMQPRVYLQPAQGTPSAQCSVELQCKWPRCEGCHQGRDQSCEHCHFSPNRCDGNELRSPGWDCGH